jgi:ring-1,2-phenylacetyl-CoA epoxidase subunit PaaB
VKSLDPRVNRLPEIENAVLAKAPLDQFGTFEVFVQPRDGKPFQHEGAVHAPDIELAFVLAKETFTRRFTCSSLFVTETRCVFVSEVTEGNKSVYESLSKEPSAEETDLLSFEIFHLLKRGKQHVHAGTVQAKSYEDALLRASKNLKPSHVVYNVWAIRTNDIRFTKEEEKDLWTTLPDKKFRDASSYKGGEKLTSFLEKN